jgi:hypothetical protein
MEENTQQSEAPKQESQEQLQQAAPIAEPKNEQRDIKKDISKFEAFLEEYLVKKAPFAIPAGGKEFIVKVAPYLAIISVIILIISVLFGFGWSLIKAPFAMIGLYNFKILAIISSVVSVILLILELIAIPGLFARTKKGWRYVFYASIVSFVGSLVSSYGYHGSYIGGIISIVIGWYILFQVKELYKN